MADVAFTPKKRLLVCVDGSGTSYDAVKYAVSMCHSQCGDELIVLTLYDNPTQQFRNYAVPPIGPVIGVTNMQDLIDEREANKKAAHACADLAVSIAQKLDPKIQTRILIQSTLDPRDDILDIATREHCTGIVMGSRGIGRLKRMLLGSCSEYVVTHADIPVTIVRPHKENPSPAIASNVTQKSDTHDSKPTDKKEDLKNWI